MKKLKAFFKNLGYVLAFMIILGVIDNVFKPESIDLLFSLYVIALLVIWFNVSIIIHELGHLAMGRLTGFKFLSYRYLSWMILKDEQGKYHFKRYSVSGTLGQCLMIPPDDETMPIFWYNFGGVLFNWIGAILSLILMLLPTSDYIIAIGVVGLSLNGLFGLTNWMPTKGGINDGNNYREAKRYPASRVAFYDVLKLNVQVTYGKHLSEIQLKSNLENLDLRQRLQSAIYTTIQLQKLYALDVAGYIEGIRVMESESIHLNTRTGIFMSIHVYFTRLLENRLDDPMFQVKLFKLVLKKMKYEPLFYVIRYTEAKLRQQDDPEAIKEALIKLAKTSNLTGEIQDCIALIDHLDQTYLKLQSETLETAAYESEIVVKNL